jgi:hypothetical protein
LFRTGVFFVPADKVQVKYEMLRAHALEGCGVAAAAAEHGYSRSNFYLVKAAFEDAGMTGLLDERPGRRGPLKLTAEIVEFLNAAGPEVSSSCWSARWSIASGCNCTCARWTGHDGGEHVGCVVPISWSGRPGRVRNAARACAGARCPAGLAGRGAVRATRVGRTRALVGGRAVFEAELVGARRRPWTPGRDPRIEVLAAAFALLLEVADRRDTREGGGQGRWVR